MSTDAPKRAPRQFVAFRLATRLARREIFRRPGRTILVALLVALPVAGMTVAAVIVRTQHQSSLQLWRQAVGQADAFEHTSVKVPLPKLPKHRAISGRRYVESRVLRTVDSHRSVPTIFIFDMADPIARGVVQIMSGRAPTTGKQVFLTRHAARDLGVKAGDTLHLVRPAPVSLEVTGVGELADVWDQSEMILPANVPYPWKASTPPQPAALLIQFTPPLSARQVHQLGGPAARSPGLVLSPALVPISYGAHDAEKKVAWSWLFGALALTVVGIVIAAAFAVGARRQLVTLGQLAGNGASPKMLRRVLFLQGTLTGVAGTIGGLGLGAIVLAVLAPHTDQLFQRQTGPLVIRLTDFVPIAVLGVVAATVAALIPARAASRVPVLAALAGRRPLSRVPRWVPATGAVVSAGGLGLLGLAVLGARGTNGGSTVWLLTAIAGGVAVLLGACAVAPFYVSVLEPAAARSRGSWRVATRSLARQRTRTSAVVSAIAATGALMIAGSSLLIAAHNHNQNQYASNTPRPTDVQLSGVDHPAASDRPPQAVIADVQKALPHSTQFQLVRPFRQNVTWSFTGLHLDHPNKEGFAALTSGAEIYDTAALNAGHYFRVVIADHAAIEAYGLSNSDQRLLARRGVLVLAFASGRATMQIVTHVAPHAIRPRPDTVEATLIDARNHRLGDLPSVLVTPSRASELGMTARPSEVVFRAPHALSADQRTAVIEITGEVQDLVPNHQVVGYQIYYPPKGIDPLLLEWLLMGVVLVLTLFVVGVNLALSAAETRDERDVLTIVGAAPGVMSRTNGYKAALLTAMGSLLAIPVALLPVAVFVAAGTDLSFVFPVRVIALLLIALPLAAGLVTAAASSLALRARPVRISTMAFD